MTADSRYVKKAAQAGLFGQAFFGHAATPEERRLLKRLWKESRREARRSGEALIDKDQRWS